MPPLIATITLNPSLDEWTRLPALRAGALHRATAFARYPGGKGINVSRVIHELGGQTLALAPAGGYDGQLLGQLLQERRLPHRFVTIPGATRNNYQIQTDFPRAITQINTPGPMVPPSALRKLQQAIERLRPPAACVVLSGSLPPGVPSTIYQRLIRQLDRSQTLSVLDASGAALRSGIAARPWLIKPNLREAEELLGRRLRRRTQIIRAAADLLRRGPECVIISLGKDGALLATRQHPRLLCAAAPSVRVDSAVGAGDSLVAGFVMGWVQTRSLLEAFRLGVACGTATALTPGTELCHRADVVRLLKRVKVKTLS